MATTRSAARGRAPRASEDAAGEGLGRDVLVLESRRKLEVVHLQVVTDRGTVAAALLGQYVHDDRAVPRRRTLQGRLERLDVVPVDRPDVSHAEVLEERVRRDHLANGRREGVDAPVGLFAHARQVRHGAPHPVAQGQVGLIEAKRRQRSREPRDGRRVAATIVVQHDDDALA
jgi:hypothetical protein